MVLVRIFFDWTVCYLVFSRSLPLVFLLFELLPGESVLVATLGYGPADTVRARLTGEPDDLFEVLQPPEVVRPHELLLRPPQPVVGLLLDPVLDTGLVLQDCLHLRTNWGLEPISGIFQKNFT